MATVNTMGTGGNQLTVQQRTYHSIRLLRYTMPNMLFFQYGAKESIPRGYNKISKRKPERLSVPQIPIPLPEGSGKPTLPTTWTALEATPVEYGEGVAYTDTLEFQAIDAIVTEFTKLVKDCAATTFDYVVRNPLLLATNGIWCGNGTVDTDIDDDSRLSALATKRAARFMDGKNVPKIQSDSYVGIAHPDVLSDLTNDSVWIEAHKYGKPAALFGNEVGMIGGVRFVSTTNAYVATDSGSNANFARSKSKLGTRADVYYTTIIGFEAYFCVDFVGKGGSMPEIVIVNPTPSVADQYGKIGIISFKGYQVSLITDEDRIVLVRSSASR